MQSDISAAEAVLEVHLEPKDEIVVRQRCELVVKFLSDVTSFAGSVDFPDVAIANALVVRPASGQSFSERRGTETWIGVEYRYAVYPQRRGSLEIPEVEASVLTGWGRDRFRVSAASEPFRRKVTVPNEIAGLADVVVTPSLHLEQDFQPDADTFRVGDAVKRTITVTADNIASILLPEIVIPSLEGIATYPASPVVEDRNVRGTITATRIDTVTIILEKEGEYTLPEVVVSWWNPDNRRLHKDTLPELKITVIANPDFAVSDTLQGVAGSVEAAEDSAILSPLQLVFGVLILALLVVTGWWLYGRYYHRVKARFVNWQKHRAESEVTYFKRFRTACYSRDPSAAMSALLAWLDRSSESSNTATLSELCRLSSNPVLEAEIAKLHKTLYGQDAGQSERKEWSGRDLYDAISRARRALKHRQEVGEHSINSLAPLNPVRNR
jgi:hypothetical protein